MKWHGTCPQAPVALHLSLSDWLRWCPSGLLQPGRCGPGVRGHRFSLDLSVTHARARARVRVRKILHVPARRKTDRKAIPLAEERKVLERQEDLA